MGVDDRRAPFDRGARPDDAERPSYRARGRLAFAAGPAAWLNRRLLAQRAVVFVGLISYPLYLWHWPLLVYLRLGLKSFALTPHRIDVLTAETVAIAVFLAVLTFRFIEPPLRRSTQLTATALRSTAALAAIAIAGMVLWQWPQVRLGDNPRVSRAVEARSDWLAADIDQGVRYASGRAGDPDVIFIGDSQGERYFPAVQHAAAAMTNWRCALRCSAPAARFCCDPTA